MRLLIYLYGFIDCTRLNRKSMINFYFAANGQSQHSIKNEIVFHNNLSDGIKESLYAFFSILMTVRKITMSLLNRGNWEMASCKERRHYHTHTRN